MNDQSITKNTDDQLLTGQTSKIGQSEDCSLVVSNADFVSAVFSQLPDGSSPAICSKLGDPNVGSWHARPADSDIDFLSAENNNFTNCSSFYPGADKSFKARKENVAACHGFMLDDLGTKAPMEGLDGFELSWLIETSPGNYQGGILLADPITDRDLATNLLNAIIAAGFCDPGASGALSRWCRLPVGINGKPKYADETGAPFRCRLVEWRPDKRYTVQEIIDGLKLQLNPAGRSKKKANPATSNQRRLGNQADDVFTPKAVENPVVSVLKDRGLYKTPLGSGMHDITCPWLQEHTDELDSGTAYFEPDDSFSLGGFCCQHSHRDDYHINQLLEFLGVSHTEARHKPVIRIVPGEVHRVVDAAERELANFGKHYQADGLIVSISIDPITGDPLIVQTTQQALILELSIAVSWERYDKRSKVWVRSDPPQLHIAILNNGQNFRHLPVLVGIVRQPYFRESDGELITQAGYDSTSQRLGVFDSSKYVFPEPTREAAMKALALLVDLLTEFHFVSPTDKAAALSAIFTAVVRTSLKYALGFHAGAPIYGSGKTYLCELIGAFAGPGDNEKVSYPTTSEEATKEILTLLLESHAVVEFDDMDTDWIPHGIIKRMLTSDKITDRILGASKTATVSTRTLFLGSGNNVGPVRDLRRRVLTIHIDPRCATPATLTYKNFPVEKVRKNRERYVSAVLTIILAWRKAGCPRADVENIVTYGGAWSDYCRYPLMWLGHPDPATALLDQVKHDPDGDTLAGLMTEWYAVFGSRPTTVRKAVEASEHGHPELLDALREFPIEERGEINRSKLGWILKKNANRIVNGLEFQKAEADGRIAWRVVKVDAPPSPPFNQSAEKTVPPEPATLNVDDKYQY